jgi:hypothetical protein
MLDGFIQDAKCGGVICAERRRRLDVAQFCECNSEWGATLGVVKTRSNFRLSGGGDHIFDDGSDIKDGSIQLIVFGGFVT